MARTGYVKRSRPVGIFLIDFFPVYDSESADHVALSIQNILAFYNLAEPLQLGNQPPKMLHETISPKLVSVTTDGAANLELATSLLGLPWVHCSNHRLRVVVSLSVQNSTPTLFLELRSLINIFRLSPLHQQHLEIIQGLEDADKNTLIGINPTRWNNWYSAIFRLISIWPQIKSFCESYRRSAAPADSKAELEKLLSDETRLLPRLTEVEALLHPLHCLSKEFSTCEFPPKAPSQPTYGKFDPSQELSPGVASVFSVGILTIKGFYSLQVEFFRLVLRQFTDLMGSTGATPETAVAKPLKHWEGIELSLHLLDYYSTKMLAKIASVNVQGGPDKSTPTLEAVGMLFDDIRSAVARRWQSHDPIALMCTPISERPQRTPVFDRKAEHEFLAYLPESTPPSPCFAPFVQHMLHIGGLDRPSNVLNTAIPARANEGLSVGINPTLESVIKVFFSVVDVGWSCIRKLLNDADREAALSHFVEKHALSLDPPSPPQPPASNMEASEPSEMGLPPSIVRRNYDLPGFHSRIRSEVRFANTVDDSSDRLTLLEPETTTLSGRVWREAQLLSGGDVNNLACNPTCAATYPLCATAVSILSSAFITTNEVERTFSTAEGAICSSGVMKAGAVSAVVTLAHHARTIPIDVWIEEILHWGRPSDTELHKRAAQWMHESVARFSTPLLTPLSTPVLTPVSSTFDLSSVSSHGHWRPIALPHTDSSAQLQRQLESSLSSSASSPSSAPSLHSVDLSSHFADLREERYVASAPKRAPAFQAVPHVSGRSEATTTAIAKLAAVRAKLIPGDPGDPFSAPEEGLSLDLGTDLAKACQAVSEIFTHQWRLFDSVQVLLWIEASLGAGTKMQILGKEATSFLPSMPKALPPKAPERKIFTDAITKVLSEPSPNLKDQMKAAMEGAVCDVLLMDGKKVVDVPNDAHCMFYALLMVLPDAKRVVTAALKHLRPTGSRTSRRGSTSKWHMKLRTVLVSFIASHETHVYESLTHDNGRAFGSEKDVSDWCDQMRKDAWGDECVLWAAASLWNVEIHVYSHRNTNIVPSAEAEMINEEWRKLRPLDSVASVDLYHLPECHYKAVIPIPEVKTSRRPKKNV